MSARIAPEPISIGITFAAHQLPRVNKLTRPVEAAEPASPDPQNSKNAGGENRPQPSVRPPGKDPSIPPQALIDASLISAEFKPVIKVELPDTSEVESVKPESAPVEAPELVVAASDEGSVPEVQSAPEAPESSVEHAQPADSTTAS